MQTEDLTQILRQHPFVADLSEEHMQTIMGCASLVVFKESDYLTHEGQSADKLYLIRTGRIALEIDLAERGALRIQTAGPGDVIGWSWLISPYRWHFSACAVADSRVVVLDGKCLKTKCESDHDFGYDMLKRLAQVMHQRLDATRLQLLDVYGPAEGVKPK